MKITSVEFHPDGSSAVCELSFRDPTGQKPYNVKGMTGLDADEIQAEAPVKREPVALIELNPRYNLGETPSSLRDYLYKMISSSRKGLVHILFKNDDVTVAQIDGRVQKFEAGLFNEIPEVQITFKCDDPWLRAPDPVSLSVVGLDPTLTTIEDDVSTAKHGVKFQLVFTGASATFVLSDDDDPEALIDVRPLGGFLTDDVLYLSSEYNDKYLYIVRAGNVIQLGDVIQKGAIWPMIYPGRPNHYAIADGVNLDWQAISYYPTFWGV